jgi:phosphatidylinositol glycan class N
VSKKNLKIHNQSTFLTFFKGGHGDGHPDCTRTPIIAWGAGVQKPNISHPTGHDDFSADWDLSAVQRNDIKQADIAPLMVSNVA